MRTLNTRIGLACKMGAIPHQTAPDQPMPISYGCGAAYKLYVAHQKFTASYLGLGLQEEEDDDFGATTQAHEKVGSNMLPAVGSRFCAHVG